MSDFDTINMAATKADFAALLTPSKGGLYCCEWCGSGTHGGPDSDGAVGIFQNDGGMWRCGCRSCGENHSFVDTVGKVKGLDKPHEMLEAAAELLGRTLEGTSEEQYYDWDSTVVICTTPKQKPETPPAKKKAPEPEPDYTEGRKRGAEYISTCAANLWGDDKRGHDYLAARGFTDDDMRKFRFGWDASITSVILPYPSSEYYSIGRDITKDTKGKGKYRKPSKAKVGSEPVFDTSVCDDPKADFFLVEGVLDAYAIKACGYNAQAFVTACNNETMKWLKQQKPQGLIGLALDNDDTGKKNTPKVLKELRAADLKVFVVPPFPGPEGEVKDAGDTFAWDRSKLADHLANALAEGPSAMNEEDSEEADEQDDGLPPLEPLQVLNPPKRPPILIEGLFEKGDKGLITSTSKAGKTWLLVLLALAMAIGEAWCGFRCTQGRVLFVDPEFKKGSIDRRFAKVANARRLDDEQKQTLAKNLTVWRLRGKQIRGQAFFDALTRRVEGGGYSLVLIDSVYKVFAGSEIDAENVGAFWAQVDALSEKTGVSVITSHHHSKGIKGDVSALDRGSGSGVWQRDPDLCLDMLEIFPPDKENGLEDGGRAFRFTCAGIRDFKGFDPVNLIYRYPLFTLDLAEETKEWAPASAQGKGGKNTAKLKKAEAQANSLEQQLKLMAHFAANPNDAYKGILQKDAADIAGANNASRFKEACKESGLFEIEQASTRKIYLRPTKKPPLQDILPLESEQDG